MKFFCKSCASDFDEGKPSKDGFCKWCVEAIAYNKAREKKEAKKAPKKKKTSKKAA